MKVARPNVFSEEFDLTKLKASTVNPYGMTVRKLHVVQPCEAASGETEMCEGWILLPLCGTVVVNLCAVGQF